MKLRTFFVRKQALVPCFILLMVHISFFTNCSNNNRDNYDDTFYQRNRAVIIFVDITNSLLGRDTSHVSPASGRDDRFERIETDVVSIIESLSFGSRIRICAVHGRTSMSFPLVNRILPVGENSYERRDFVAQKDTIEKVFLRQFRALRHSNEQKLLSETCIRETISQIIEFRDDLDINEFQLDAIYLSDMEETCVSDFSMDQSLEPIRVLNTVKVYLIPTLTTTGDISQEYRQIEHIKIDWSPFFVANGVHPDSIKVMRQLPAQYQEEFPVFSYKHN